MQELPALPERPHVGARSSDVHRGEPKQQPGARPVQVAPFQWKTRLIGTVASNVRAQASVALPAHTDVALWVSPAGAHAVPFQRMTPKLPAAIATVGVGALIRRIVVETPVAGPSAHADPFQRMMKPWFEPAQTSAVPLAASEVMVAVVSVKALGTPVQPVPSQCEVEVSPATQRPPARPPRGS